MNPLLHFATRMAFAENLSIDAAHLLYPKEIDKLIMWMSNLNTMADMTDLRTCEIGVDENGLVTELKRCSPSLLWFIPPYDEWYGLDLYCPGAGQPIWRPVSSFHR